MIRDVSVETACRDIAADIRRRAKAPGVESGGNLFLFGAGASRSCGIPLAHEIVADLGRRRRLRRPSAFSQAAADDYTVTMSRLTPEEQLAVIRTYIERARAIDGRWRFNYCYLVLSEIWKTYPGYPRTLLTTNFDPLFHYALLERNIEAKLIRSAGEAQYLSPFHTRRFPAIVYLHGYWQNHFLHNTLEDFRTFRRDWRRYLVPSLLPYGLVVVGYSGHPDDVVMQTLLTIRRTSTRMAGPLYWCYKDQIAEHTGRILRRLGNAVGVRIADADQFMLKLGATLGLPQGRQMAVFSAIVDDQSPGPVQPFRSHADITLEPSRSLDEIAIVITTHPRYRKPGENYAGIDILSARRLFDLSAYSHAVLTYDAEVAGSRGSGRTFEFKLQSQRAAHIENLPIGMDRKVEVSLDRYAADGVDLRAVDRIIFAANCTQIGSGSTLTLKLKRIAWRARTGYLTVRH